MYNRNQLVDILGYSKSTIRKLLAALQIQPQDIELNKHSNPIYLYSQQQLQLIKAYIAAAKSTGRVRQPGKHRCRGGCNRYFQKQKLNASSICSQCAIKARMNNFAYDKQCKLNKSKIQYAINYLKSLIS